MELSDEILNYIANNIKSNIRELEGSLNKLIALSNLDLFLPFRSAMDTLKCSETMSMISSGVISRILSGEIIRTTRDDVWDGRTFKHIYSPY